MTTFINFPDYSIPFFSIVIIDPVEIIRYEVETIIEPTAINLKTDIFSLYSLYWSHGISLSIKE